MPKYENLPEPIPDTPENVAKLIMQAPPKKKWRYLDDEGEDNLKDDSGPATT